MTQTAERVLRFSSEFELRKLGPRSEVYYSFVSVVHSLIHSTILTEHLLCVRHCSRDLGYLVKKIRQNILPLWNLESSKKKKGGGETDSKHKQKHNT